MTYAIGYFVFGINLKNVPKQFADEAEALAELDIAETQYNGSGDEPFYLGTQVARITEIDDMSWSEITELKDKLKAATVETHNEYVEFSNRLDQALAETEISDSFKDWLKAQKPEVFLTWGSS